MKCFHDKKLIPDVSIHFTYVLSLFSMKSSLDRYVNIRYTADLMLALYLGVLFLSKHFYNIAILGTHMGKLQLTYQIIILCFQLTQEVW